MQASPVHARIAQIHSTRVHTGKRLAATRSIQLALSDLACASHYDSRGARRNKENEMRRKWRELFCSRASVIAAPDASGEHVMQSVRRASRAGCISAIDWRGRAGGGLRAIHLLRPSYRARYIRGVHSKLQSAHLLSLVYSARRKQRTRWEKAAGEM